MSATEQVHEEQAAGGNTDQRTRWNGRDGCAWVEAQEALDRMFTPFQELLVQQVPAGSGWSVLDVGCGTGATTLALAQRTGSIGRAVGIDISEPMITLARQRAAAEDSAASFLVADAQSYVFEPASFDLVTSRFGVMFFSDPVLAFANLRAALKADGRLQAIAWRGPADNPFMTTAERAAAPLLPNLPPRKADGPGQFAFADPKKVTGILEESGWHAIDIRPLDLDCVLPTPELERFMTRLGPLGQVLQDENEGTRLRVTAAVRAAFEPFVHGEEVRYTAACWMVVARSGPVIADKCTV
jgi:SAM-dependent methyltransferase